MTETDYTKECLSLYSRMMLAALALFAITLGATFGMFIAKAEAVTPVPTAVVPGIMIDFTTFGLGGSTALFVVFLYFAGLTAQNLLKLRRATEVSNV